MGAQNDEVQIDVEDGAAINNANFASGNAATGVRAFSIASSPLTYANVEDGSHAEVHGAGEVDLVGSSSRA